MLKFLKRTAGLSRAAPPAIPEGQRVYAVGDIHGRADLFDHLLEKIAADDGARAPAETTLILLGDLIDRGPGSCQVIERAMELEQSGRDVRFLMGNHEEVFLEALKDPCRETARFFYRIGGGETMLSYGLPEKELIECDSLQLAERMPSLVPQSHIDFLERFDDQLTIGDYVFVHAGVKPGVPMEEQKQRHLRWIRDEFLHHDRYLGKMVVHGHTVTEAVEERPHRIGVDTGAWSSGLLTAVALEGTERWFVDTADVSQAA